MNKVYTLDGIVCSMPKLDSLRKWMEDEVVERFGIKYKKTQLTNVVYDDSKDVYKFTLEFLG